MTEFVANTTNNLPYSYGSEQLMLIEREIAGHPILHHPFLELLKAGQFKKSQIAIWISQQYYFSKQFPRCLAALYARLEDIDVSMPLMKFLSIEHWGSEEKSAHWKQFTKTISYFGFQPEDLKHETPYNETKEYLNFRLQICLTRSVEEGLGAIAFGHEYVNTSIFDNYLSGMKKLEGITKDSLNYFQSHVEDEPYDYEIFKHIILRSCSAKDSFNLIRKGALDVLEARYNFFDKILEKVKLNYKISAF